MNSKTEKDSRLLFKKVKLIYNSLPSWMRPTSQAGSSRDYLFFGWKDKDEFGNTIDAGLGSDIEVIAPTPTGWEGRMLYKWICDEGGKLPILVQMFSFTEACLSNGGIKRVGTPVIFGTSGEVDKDGAGLKELWYASESYGLKRFLYSGIMGLVVDEFGNDDEQESLRHILSERDSNKAKSLKSQQDFIQQYPLSAEEAFLAADGGGIGNPLMVKAKIDDLKQNPATRTQGKFYKLSGTVTFEASPTGFFTMFEYPRQELTNANVAGCDPVDHKSTDKKASFIAATFIAKAHGMSPPKILGRYYGKPNDPIDAYEQIAMACIFFKCSVLIERNRYGMISYFEQNGYQHLLKMEPVDKTRIYQTAPNRYGVHMTEDKKLNHMAPLMDDFVNKYIDYIPDQQLLEECGDWLLKNTDILMSFGLALLSLEDEYKEAAKEGSSKAKLFKTKLVKINGVLQRIAS